MTIVNQAMNFCFFLALLLAFLVFFILLLQQAIQLFYAFIPSISLMPQVNKGGAIKVVSIMTTTSKA